MKDLIVNFWSVRGYVAEIIQSFRELHLEIIFCFAFLLIFCVAISFSGNSYQVNFYLSSLKND